jgi:hypothetical protein
VTPCLKTREPRMLALSLLLVSNVFNSLVAQS